MKVTIIGAGNVGATCAHVLAISGKIDEIILLDTNKGYAEGKSMDINQSLSILENGTSVKGFTNDYKFSSNSDIIVIAAGAKRTSEMTRNDLLQINSKIIKDITSKSIKYSPNAIFIIATNPLDNMVYQALISSKLPRNRIIGMAGILDNARYVSFISQKLKVNSNSIKAIVMGSHNNDMLILSRYTTINGIPLSNFINEKEIKEIIEKTKNGGKQIIEFSGTSAYYAPGTAIAKIVESIAIKKRTFLTASVMLEGEYGIKKCSIGVPVIIGEKGLMEIIKIDLNKKEKELFHKSVENIKNANSLLKP